jgi:hypothetical protein
VGVVLRDTIHYPIVHTAIHAPPGHTRSLVRCLRAHFVVKVNTNQLQQRLLALHAQLALLRLGHMSVTHLKVLEMMTMIE